MNKLTTTLLSFVALVGLATTLAPAYVGASTADKIRGGVESTTTKCNPTTLKDSEGKACSVPKTLAQTLKTVINTMLYVLGALAVIMIVVGGIRYTTSGGDSARVKSAKDTLMYSIVGLIVALFAFAIVNFVVGALGS